MIRGAQPFLNVFDSELTAVHGRSPPQAVIGPALMPGFRAPRFVSLRTMIAWPS